MVLLLALLPGSSAGAQGRPVFEWGLHSTGGVRGTDSGIADGPLSLVVGPRGAIRTLGSTRIALSIGTGTHGEELTARGEAAIEYLLSPRAAKRPGVYLGGGLAGVLGGGKGGYLLAYVGVERSPGLPGGWALEAGLGGGFRVRLAYHWRKFPRGWRAQ
ncbi:MAG TPA: hypothetical protein VLB00_06600 [Gemmatimonadales bacterium]|nr:hypothetical protein [Gemmatimonadales bacterium]